MTSEQANYRLPVILAVVMTVLAGLGVAVVVPLMFFLSSTDVCQIRPGADRDRESVVGPWGPHQVDHAETIIFQGIEQGMTPFAWQIALATALQESRLEMYANEDVPESLDLPHDRVGSDHDSVGLFQQRPSMGWGSVAELMDAATSAQKFYTALLDVEGWESMSVAEAAQAVQVSAYPDAYEHWAEEADILIAELTGLESWAMCAYEYSPPSVGASGWVAPVDAPLWDGFGTRGGQHFGVDLGAERHIPIVAAATGVVRTSECNTPQGCGEGSREFSGCGWMVVIDHDHYLIPEDAVWDGMATRYCHMQSQPLVSEGEWVTAGQVIGYVGNSGDSSAPHLHYEVHQNVSPSGRVANATAIDPVAWHEDVGAPL
ncbi:M23 family metallopeptidase [Natronoglycomyces albus]|uniref:M23 family metallopeptidase n=1 Tax=Natronoglycomyces albus TaxID=2811108 RepID=A0A895XVA8_9ACTN|nr:M23 family metallopeptidase [Natronoglycomyces albus]QSB07189.1 M23 family metallopeptidase [Natronoglycomyces albus]